MTRYGFLIDNRRCIGCHACTVACKAEHSVPVGVNRTWVKYIEKGEFPDVKRHFSVMRCNHCADAPCIDVCPTGALFRRDNGIVDFDTSVCIACKACTQACPYDAIYIDPETTTAQKCNYCAHRVEKNLLPSCVVVCPTTAIVAGDLQDPGSRIAQLVKTESVSVRKAEKGTHPGVYYIDGDPLSLTPNLAASGEGALWSAQSGGVGYHTESDFTHIRSMNAEAVPLPAREAMEAEARRVYDAPDKGVLWGWKVSAYVVTKAVAAGISGLASLFALSGVDGANAARSYLVALLFLAVTGVLLVWDLGQPKKFFMVMTRMRFNSWLVRGAYILGVFGMTTFLLWQHAMDWYRLSPALARLCHTVNLLGAFAAAVYTAFLLRQCKGRDAWGQWSLVYHFALHAPLCALAYFVAIEGMQLDLACWAAVSASLFVMGMDALQARSDATLKALHAHIVSARRKHKDYYFGVLFVGHVLPLGLLAAGADAPWLLGVSVLLGQILHADMIIREPQRVPLA